MRNWYEALCKALLELEFERTEADHGVFIKKLQNGGVVIVAVHIDEAWSPEAQNLLLINSELK